MSKPVRQSVITTMEGLKGDVSALFDMGSFLSLIREDKLPQGALILHLKEPKIFGTADTGAGNLRQRALWSLRCMWRIMTFLFPHLSRRLCLRK